MDTKTNGAQIFMVSPSKLSPHPLIEQHFTAGTEEEIESLKRSIKELVMLHPIVAKDNGEIISGRDRWSAAKELSSEAVPVRFMKFRTKEAEELAILAANLCVRAVSPVVAARGLERMEELRSGNGGPPARLDEIDFPKDLSPGDRKRFASNYKRGLQAATQKAREEGYEQGKKDSEKRLSEVVSQRDKYKAAVGDLIAERDKLQLEVMEQRQELKEGKAKLARQINTLKSEKEEEARKAKKEIEKLQAQLKKLTDRSDKLAAKVVKAGGDIGPRERRLLALAVQISRVGPEVLVPSVAEMLEGKERKKEITDALHKLNSWSSEMEQAL